MRLRVSARGTNRAVVVLSPVAAIQIRDPDTELRTHRLHDIATTNIDPDVADEIGNGTFGEVMSSCSRIAETSSYPHRPP